MPECILRKHWQLLLLLSYPAAFTRGHLCVDIVFDTITYLPVIRANWNFNEIKPARAKVEACTRSVKVNSFVSFYRKKLRGSRKLFPLFCFYIDMIWERELAAGASAVLMRDRCMGECCSGHECGFMGFEMKQVYQTEVESESECESETESHI